MSKHHWFPFYAESFLVSTMGLPAAAVGAYIRLLSYQWVNGGVPDDEDAASGIAGCDRIVLASIWHKFGICENSLRMNARLEEVRKEQESVSLKNAENARKRWEKRQNGTKTDAIASNWHQSGICETDAKTMPLKLNKDSIAHAREIPTREEVLKLANARCIPADCAEKFWLDNDSVGWIDRHSRPIQNWKSALTGYATAWRANSSTSSGFRSSPLLTPAKPKPLPTPDAQYHPSKAQ